MSRNIDPETRGQTSQEAKDAYRWPQRQSLLQEIIKRRAEKLPSLDN